MGIYPPNITLYLSSLARIKPLSKAEETDISVSTYASALKVDAADLSEGAFALTIRQHRRDGSNWFPGYGTFLSDLKTNHGLLIAYAEKKRKAAQPLALPDYTADNLPQWLQAITTEMRDAKHGRYFANGIPCREWLVAMKHVWDRVLVRDKQLWFLSLKDYDIFNNTNKLRSGAVAAGYETRCRELAAYYYRDGKLRTDITFDPLHIIPDWALNKENQHVNNERKTA